MNMDGFGLIADDWKQETWEVLDLLVDSQWLLLFRLLLCGPYFLWSRQVATYAAENLLLNSTAVQIFCL